MEPMASEGYLAEEMEMDMGAQAKEASYQADDQQSNGGQNTSIEKKVIRTANLDLEVEKYAAARQQLEAVVKKHNAYIDNESERKTYRRIENQLRIRVKPEAFDACIIDLEQLALNVNSKAINAQDVTQQYVDLETRLASKRAVVEQYRNILKQASSIEDILAVQENLRRVTEEIESSEAQLRYLKNQVGLSTIDILMYEPVEQSPIKRKGFFARVGSAFKSGWSGLVEFAIALVTIWPFLLMAVAGVILFSRFRRRRKDV